MARPRLSGRNRIFAQASDADCAAERGANGAAAPFLPISLALRAATAHGCRLVKATFVDYRHAMSKKTVIGLALLCCAAPPALADTIQLHDKAAVVGKVLTEKRDQVVVDIGYTVISIQP